MHQDHQRAIEDTIAHTLGAPAREAEHARAVLPLGQAEMARVFGALAGGSGPGEALGGRATTQGFGRSRIGRVRAHAQESAR